MKLEQEYTRNANKWITLHPDVCVFVRRDDKMWLTAKEMPQQRRVVRFTSKYVGMWIIEQ